MARPRTIVGRGLRTVSRDSATDAVRTAKCSAAEQLPSAAAPATVSRGHRVMWHPGISPARGQTTAWHCVFHRASLLRSKTGRQCRMHVRPSLQQRFAMWAVRVSAVDHGMTPRAAYASRDARPRGTPQPRPPPVTTPSAVLPPRRVSSCLVGAAEWNTGASRDARAEGGEPWDGPCPRMVPVMALRIAPQITVPCHVSPLSTAIAQEARSSWGNVSLLVLRTPAGGVARTRTLAQEAGDKIAPPSNAKPVLLIQQTPSTTRR